MTPDDFRGSFSWLRMTERADERMIAMIPESRWSFSPAPGTRTLGELVSHLYGSEIATLKAFQAGRMTYDDYQAAHPPTISSSAEAIELMHAAHELRDRVLEDLTPEQLVKSIELFYGTFVGAMILTFIYDEHWHHRGQLTVYLRAIGLEPPFIYDVEEEEAEGR